MRVRLIDPLVLSALISPLAPVTLIPWFTELRLIFPRAPSTTISPSIVLAETVPEPPFKTMSPRTVSTATSFCAPSTVT